MKKLVVMGISLALLAGAISQAGAAKPKQQVVEGTVALPAPFYGFALGGDGCFAGGHRRVATVSGGAAPNGTIGYEFEVDKATWNKPFVLEATGGEGTVDLDIFMYSHMPPLEEWTDPNNQPGAAQNGGTPVSVDYMSREAGGESGKVPPQTTTAIVCLYGGPTGYAGFNASFTYTAGKGVKLPK